MKVKELIAKLKRINGERRIDIVVHENGEERELNNDFEIHREDTDDEYIEFFIHDGTL